QRARVLAGATDADTLALRRAYTSGGARGFWEFRREELEDAAEDSYVEPYEFATVYAALGDRDRAFAALDRAYREHSSALPAITSDAMMDSLRSDPRYRALLAKLRLPAR